MKTKSSSDLLDGPSPEATPQAIHKHPFVVPVLTFLVLFFASLVGFVMTGSQTMGATDTHTVHLFVGGKEQVVPTRAKTVGELLERRGIKVADKDIIEPSLDTEITVDNFEVNYYQAKPVMVVDEGKKKVIVSAEPTPQAVAEEAGVKVYPEDRIERTVTDLTNPTEAIQDGLVAEQVVIDRAVPASLNVYGKTVTVRSHVKTVGDLLAEKNVQVRSGDTLKPSADTPLVPNLQIFIARQGTKIVTEEEQVEMPVEVIEDPNLAAGTVRVRTPGSPGEKLVTYEIKTKNGKEVGRNILQEIIVTAAIPQLEVRGTRVIISNPSENVKIGEAMAADRGWTGSEWYCLYQLWQKESGWNHLASNPYSGAHGIPQALPGSKMGAGWQSDPNVQIRWGLGYIAGRYGTPCGAWSQSQASGWY